MRALLPFVTNLRDGKNDPVGSLDGYAKLAYEKAVYWLEEVARRARAEGLQNTHDQVMGVSHPPVAARRDGGA